MEGRLLDRSDQIERENQYTRLYKHSSPESENLPYDSWLIGVIKWRHIMKQPVHIAW